MQTLREELEHFVIGNKEYDIYRILAENETILEKLNSAVKTPDRNTARKTALKIIQAILDDKYISKKLDEQTSDIYELALKIENLNDLIVYWLTH